MADNGVDFILVDSAVGDSHGLFRLARIITLNQLDFLTVNPAGSVNIFSGLRCAVPVLIAVGGIGACEWPGHANDNICPGGKCRHQTTGQHKRKRSSD